MNNTNTTNTRFQVMHEQLSMYYGLVTSSLYVFGLIGMFVAMLVINRLISEEKKKDKKALRGQPNLKRFGNFQGNTITRINRN